MISVWAGLALFFAGFLLGILMFWLMDAGG